MTRFKLSSKYIPSFDRFHAQLVSFPEYVGIEVEGDDVWIHTNVQPIQSLINAIEAIVPANMPMNEYINNRIAFYQSVAPALLRELYTANTLSGITTPQSDEMMQEFTDVLLRIKEGLFPTAVYRLEQKVPSGYVTQALIDTWKHKIQTYMG